MYVYPVKNYLINMFSRCLREHKQQHKHFQKDSENTTLYII